MNQIIFLFLLLQYLDVTKACNGYDIYTTYIRNCESNDEQIFRILPNSSIRINSKCELISNVCNNVKSFSKMQSSLVVSKGVETIFNKTLDICEYKGKFNEMSKAVQTVYGFRGCSMKPGQYCEKGTKMLTFSSFQRTFSLFAGDIIELRNRITFDTGKTCIEAEVVFRKKERKN